MAAAQDDAGTGLYRYRFGSAEFDQAKLELRVDGELVEVQQRPLEVLLELLSHPGEVVTREQLQETVWEGRPTVDNVVGNAVKKLRAALGPTNADRIETKHGVGYRFVGQLERMAVGRSHLAVTELGPGMAVPERLGFVLTQRLANSQRSDVWLAHHPETGEQRVYKFASDGDGLTSLKREATVARIMAEAYPQRDHLVRVLGQNFITAPFFLECAYGGQNLADWAAADDRIAQLSLTARLDLFLRIADAVAAAHAIGVLHKDLKPSNVLIAAADDTGDEWTIRLADFGSSRLLDPASIERLGITQLGFTVTTLNASDDGTPLYLAPELLAGQPPTVRSDIYALGVMLYQLIAGNFRQPLVPGWERTIEDGFIRHDIARATDVDPEQRFAGVQELVSQLRAIEERRLAQDQRRIATQEAELTRLAYLRERARRPWLVATIVVLALSLVTGGWFTSRLAVARTTATTEAGRAEAVSGFLQDMLRNSDPAKGKGYDVTIKDALARTVTDFETRFAKAPMTEVAVRRAAANLHISLTDYRAAAAHLERIVALHSAEYGATDPRTLEARYTFGKVLVQLADFPRAKQILEEADRDAAALSPERDLKLAVVSANAWGKFYLFQVKMAEAQPFFEQAQRTQLALDPKDGNALLLIRIDLAQVYNHSSRPKEAIKLLQDLNSPLYAETVVGKPTRAKADYIYGSALMYDGQLSEAQPHLEAALRSIETMYGPESSQAAQLHVALGLLFGQMNEPMKSLPHIQQSRKFFCDKYGMQYPVCLQQMANEGVSYAQLGDYARALREVKASYDGFRALNYTDDNPAIQITSFYLATVSLALGKVSEAAALVKPLDAKLLASVSPGDEWGHRLPALRGAIAIAQGDHDGRALLHPALAALETDKDQEWIIAPLRRYREGSENRERTSGADPFRVTLASPRPKQ